MEYKHIPDLAGYMYHLKHKPSELIVNLFSNTMLNKTISVDKVLNSINKYGCYSFCYNYSCTKFFTQYYLWFKAIFPESDLLDGYRYATVGDPMHCSAQGNQMFTSYECLCNVRNNFSYYWNVFENYDKLRYEDYPNVFNKRTFNRQIRGVVEHFFTQLFFKTYSYPSNLELLGETESCLYGFAFQNFNMFGYILTGVRQLATNDHYHLWLKMKDDSQLVNCFNKFCSGELIN